MDSVPTYFKAFSPQVGSGIHSIVWTDRPGLARLLDDEQEAKAVVVLVLSRIGQTEMRLTIEKIFVNTKP